MGKKLARLFRLVLLITLLSTMTGCFYWWRAYQTYLQMDDFDKHFAISVQDSFVVHFKDPILFSEDFVSLAKLRPTTMEQTADGKLWTYRFLKVDKQGYPIKPPIEFYFDLTFNQDDKIKAWSFSPLFLQIAPPEFLELSFRSLGGAEINEGKKQLKVNTDKVKKIDADLPLKSAILAKLGEPLDREDDQEGREVYFYHFELLALDVEEGYESRLLSKIELTFDKTTQELVNMNGRFAGLKISIDYRKYQQRRQTTQDLA